MLFPISHPSPPPSTSKSYSQRQLILNPTEFHISSPQLNPIPFPLHRALSPAQPPSSYQLCKRESLGRAKGFIDEARLGIEDSYLQMHVLMTTLLSISGTAPLSMMGRPGVAINPLRTSSGQEPRPNYQTSKQKTVRTPEQTTPRMLELQLRVCPVEFNC